jgi:hypothetical protein
MSTSCLVANVSFYYALIKDLHRGHENSKARTISVSWPGTVGDSDLLASVHKRLSMTKSVTYIEDADAFVKGQRNMTIADQGKSRGMILNKSDGEVV